MNKPLANEDKIKAIQYAIDNPNTEELYYKLLEDIDGLKRNYWDYMTTEPINCDTELERLPEADWDLACALLTMLLREDHFCNGSLMERHSSGQVDAILNRMIVVLKEM